MDGGRLRCFITFFRYNALLLLVVCLHDMEASRCKQYYGRVGETVELSSDLPTEGVTTATWKYKEITIENSEGLIPEHHPFSGRVNMNPTNYSLTIRKLTDQDSGNFSFLSDGNEGQRETVCITLRVEELLKKQPELSMDVEWHDVNKSCTVQLQCSSTSHASVSYKWTVRNQTLSGSTLRYVFRPQDGDTNFTCTIFNSLGEKSAYETLKCPPPVSKEWTHFIIFLGAAGGSCLIIVIIVGITVVVCHRKRTRAGSESDDLTVYADICDVANAHGPSSPMQPSSVYETIDNKVNTATPGPQTVYDKIQLSRVLPRVS